MYTSLQSWIYLKTIKKKPNFTPETNNIIIFFILSISVYYQVNQHRTLHLYGINMPPNIIKNILNKFKKKTPSEQIDINKTNIPLLNR